MLSRAHTHTHTHIGSLHVLCSTFIGTTHCHHLSIDIQNTYCKLLDVCSVLLLYFIILACCHYAPVSPTMLLSFHLLHRPLLMPFFNIMQNKMSSRNIGVGMFM